MTVLQWCVHGTCLGGRKVKKFEIGAQFHAYFERVWHLLFTYRTVAVKVTDLMEVRVWRIFISFPCVIQSSTMGQFCFFNFLPSPSSSILLVLYRLRAATTAWHHNYYVYNKIIIINSNNGVTLLSSSSSILLNNISSHHLLHHCVLLYCFAESEN